MIYPVCQSCGLHQYCKSPVLKGQGSLNPKMILVLSSPDVDEDHLGHMNYPLLSSCLGTHLSNVYITYAVKCSPYKDIITHLGGNRTPTTDEIRHCRTLLFKELFAFDESIPIVALGNTALNSLFDQNEGVTKEIGIGKRVSILNKTFSVIPNYHPQMVARNPHLFNQFKQVLLKVMNGDTQSPLKEDRIKLLNYDESITYLNRVLDQYRANEIDYIVFDIESTSLSPFKGKSIMYSFATEIDPMAYSIPLVVNNEFRKENTLAAFGVTGNPEYVKELNDLYLMNEQLVPKEKGKKPKKQENQLLLDPVLQAQYEKNLIRINTLRRLLDVELEESFQNIVKKYTIPFDITPGQANRIDVLVKQIVETIPIVGQNLKFDLMFKMVESGFDLYKVKIKADTYIMGHQIQGPRAGSLSLKNQAKTLFNVQDDWDRMIDDKQGYLSKYRLVEERQYGNIPTGILGEYSALDAYWNKYVYKSHLDKFSPEQLDILEEVTRATIPFAEAEGKGVFVDLPIFNYLKTSFDSTVGEYLANMRGVPLVQALVKERMAPLQVQNDSPRKKKKMTEEEMLKECFSPSSHPDIRFVLHDKKMLNLPVVDKFKTEGGQPGTSADALEYLLKNHVQENESARVFLENLLKYKELETLRNRLAGIPENIFDGLYKTDFSLARTVTGRLSSSFHSIPSKSDFKRIFGSRWAGIGGLFLAADQSQLEVRIGASIANETTLIDAYRTGIDVHTQTAADIFKIPFEEVTSKQRGIAKAINFGILYGKTSHSLGPELGMTKEEAQGFIDQWYANKPNIRKWIPEQIAKVLKDGYVITPMGRVIYVPEAFSKDFSQRKHAENCAINFPIQSSASDIGIRAGNEIAYGLKAEQMKSLFLASVHDSLEYDVYPGEIFYLMKKVKYEAEVSVREKYPWIKCPLKMDLSLGVSWGGALELNIQELSDNQLTATAEGLRKDFVMLETVAQRAYQVKTHVIKKSEPKPFPIDCVVRDTELWEAEIVIKR